MIKYFFSLFTSHITLLPKKIDIDYTFYAWKMPVNQTNSADPKSAPGWIVKLSSGNSYHLIFFDFVHLLLYLVQFVVLSDFISSISSSFAIFFHVMGLYLSHVIIYLLTLIYKLTLSIIYFIHKNSYIF